MILDERRRKERRAGRKPVDDGWRAAFDMLREEVKELRQARRWQWVAIGAIGAWAALVSLKGLDRVLAFLSSP